MAKEKKQYTDEEIKDMTPEQIEALAEIDNKDDEDLTAEEREERDAMGEENSPQRRSLYKRFKEVNERNKENEKELNRLRAERDAERRELLDDKLRRDEAPTKEEKDDAPAKPAPVDVKELRRQMFVQMKEGEFDKAQELQGKIDAYADSLDEWRDRHDAWKERQTEKRVKKAADEAGSAALTKAEQNRVNAELVREAGLIYKRMPFLNHANADTKDDDAIAAVLTRKLALEKEGLDPVSAMKQAAEEKGPRFAKINGYDEDGKKIDDDKGDDKDKKDDKKDAGKTRAQLAIEKANRDAARTPPAPGKGGASTREIGKKSVKDMTDDEIRKLEGDELKAIDGSNRVDDE